MIAAIVPMPIDHYENFPVASVLCPPTLRPAVRAIYAFARTADDLADEGEDSPEQRLQALLSYRAELHAVASGCAPGARWAQIFTPLQRTIVKHHLPLQPLDDLLSAFLQDVAPCVYADRSAVLDYCRRSANPVGRLLLHLYGISQPHALRQSDHICTALQLINFWQDLSIDIPRGRMYVPHAERVCYGVTSGMLQARHDTAATRGLVKALVGWAREHMQQGLPLVHTLRGRAGWELRLVVQGGLAILKKIEALQYRSLQVRPRLRWHDGPALAWNALTMGGRQR
jgi:hydroxysqualene synthase